MSQLCISFMGEERITSGKKSSLNSVSELYSSSSFLSASKSLSAQD